MVTTKELNWLESREERDNDMAQYSQEAAATALEKAKALVWASWGSNQVCSTKQLAEYYEVTQRSINLTRSRYSHEFLEDGLVKITKKAIKVLSLSERNSLYLSGNESSCWLWTPRSALRIGMLLVGSEVAKEVRTVMLDTTTSVPDLLKENERLRRQIANYENRDRDRNQRQLKEGITDKAKPWTEHFDPKWRREAERVCGFSWDAPCMAQFINQAVYHNYDLMVQQELDRVNPINPETGRRHRKQHQHFSEAADPRLLEAINVAYTLMRISKSRTQFLQAIADYYGEGNQLVLF
ncbi:MAG: hypothetical protein F6K55_03350 [Moorea sp. SIO4A3]|nr:hypothetical protein [Moorena sp. SIO4A3]